MAQEQEELIPPPELNFVGKGDFERVGEGILRQLIEPGGLKPDDNVLDVGCGIGRAAVPLTRFLSEKGRYEGFDIVPAGIDWCKDKISKRYNNFNFQLSNVHNKIYHPSGWLQSDEYTFPYADESFDFVFLISVFTHILPPGMENYLSEISRVMKTGGRCFITYFLFDDETEKLMRAGRSHDVSFAHKVDEKYYVMNPQQPEMAVCYKEDYIRTLYRENGLEIDGPLHFGNWCERSGDLKEFQDTVVARKERHDNARNRVLRFRRRARLLRPSSIQRAGVSLAWRLLPSPVKSMVRRRFAAGWAGSR